MRDGVRHVVVNGPEPCLPSLPVNGGGYFVVGRIFCVGRNYANHAREMGGDPDREPPFFFTKQSNALRMTGSSIPYPSRTQNLHHEVELVVAIGSSGRCERPEDAVRLIYGYAVGIDFTRRDMQDEAKAARRPWDMSKSFDGAAPVGPIRIGSMLDVSARIELAIGGTTKQSGKLSEMIWSVPEILVELSRYQQLAAGDLIFTGTPEGVGPAMPGDSLSARITGLPPLDITIVA